LSGFRAVFASVEIADPVQQDDLVNPLVAID
jgi:hypothetical protein